MLGGIAAVILAAPAAVSTAGARTPAVVLLPLRALGLDAELAGALEQTLRNELSALPEARAGNERRVLAATASQLGDSFLVDLKLLDRQRGRELRRVTRSVTGSRNALIESLREAAVELLAPDRFFGALRIDVPGAPGALVFVDGKPAGAAPLAKPIEGLSPGSHTVRVEYEDSREASTFVEIRYGRTTEARIDLGSPLASTAVAAPRGRRWLRTAAYTGLGLGLANALVGLGYYARASATASELNRREQLNLLLPGDAAAYDRLDRDLTRARVFYATGAALALLGAAAFYWDWRSDRLAVAAGPGQVAVQARF